VRLQFSKVGKARFISHLDLMSTMRRALLRAGVSLKYSEGFNPHPYMSVALPLPIGCASVCEFMDVRVGGVDALAVGGGERGAFGGGGEVGGFVHDASADGGGETGAFDGGVGGVVSGEIGDFGGEIDGEVGFSCDAFVEKINAQLPEGIKILDIYTPMRKLKEISWVEIFGILYYDKGAPADAAAKLAARYSERSIIISKKTKRSVSDLDIAPFIRDIEFDDADEVTIKAKVFVHDPTVSTDNLLAALSGGFAELAPDYASFTRLEVFDAGMRPFR